MGRVPRPGHVKTRLTSRVSPEQAAELYRAFLLDVLDVAESAAREIDDVSLYFSVALSSEDTEAEARAILPDAWTLIRQSGATLDARIEHACTATNAAQILVLGSDSPTMAPARIAEAFSGLDAGYDAVVGPTTDGGYDLIAFAGARLPLLEEIPWSTPDVMRTTRARAQAHGLALLELSLGYDIDEPEDLLRAYEDAQHADSLAKRTRVAIADILALLQPER